jgi:hypothetical protein
MKKVLRFLLIIPLMTTLGLNGQPYEHAAGVRAGYSSGITYKGFFRYQMTAVEADILYNRHGFSLTGLYQWHLEPFQNKRWLFYGGGGGFGGNWAGEVSAGVALVGGVEFVVRDLPLNFSLDWKPMFNLFRVRELDLLDAGISIRYRFNL